MLQLELVRFAFFAISLTCSHPYAYVCIFYMWCGVFSARYGST